MKRYSFAGVNLTDETIQRTREHFIDIHRRCIEEAQSGQTRVNDLASYVAWQEDCIADMADKEQFSVTFLQRAHWLQTGECVALLP